ncbi:hypothetical protein QVA66_08390 [Staphylococcus chromogenes]|nr:hypothetical protein [Staphylococcus chromogenes]
MALTWGERRKTEAGVEMQVLDDARVLADFTEPAQGPATAILDGVTWTYTREDDVARASDGNITFEARAQQGFKKSKVINTNVNLRDIDFVNEQKSDWVVEENDVKLGQFTGANHGVRRVTVDLEPDAELEDAEKVFVAWVARIALEEKMVAMTWGLTLSLIVATIIAIVTFLL